MHNLFYTFNVILNSHSCHKAAVLQSPLPKIMKHSSFRQAIQLLCLLLFRSDTSVESSCSTLMTRLSCMTQRRTQSLLTSRAWQHLWTALTATDNALSTAFETRHKGSNWTAFFSSYNMEKPYFIPMRYLFYLSLLALFSHIWNLHRRLTVLKEVLLCRDYD